MEKKYYFRGLGLGIIVTAVIMGIALSGGGKKEKMTDAEVIARAKELGMIEDSTLLEASQEKETEDGQNGVAAEPAQKEEAVRKDIAVAAQAEEAEQKANQEQEKPDVGAPESLQEKEDKAAEAEKSGKTENSGESGEAEATAPKPDEKKPTADTNEMTKQDEDVPTPDTVKRVIISSGDGSYTVAKKLSDAGVVSSADAYDDFLCANGYDKKLRPGTFEIPAHASDEQIAKIVTGQE